MNDFRAASFSFRPRSASPSPTRASREYLKRLPIWNRQNVPFLLLVDIAVVGENDRGFGVGPAVQGVGDGVEAVRLVEVVVENDRPVFLFLHRGGKFVPIFNESDILK